jgi:hypothetical protein
MTLFLTKKNWFMASLHTNSKKRLWYFYEEIECENIYQIIASGKICIKKSAVAGSAKRIRWWIGGRGEGGGWRGGIALCPV